MIRQLATYQIRPEGIATVREAIRVLVGHVREYEPDILRYEAWQERDDPTRFSHSFVFRTAAAEQAHSDSAATKRFAALPYPLWLAPVSCVDYELVATNLPQGRV